jgi:hypothetical protein
MKKSTIKFEEDIIAPHVSKFSISVTLVVLLFTQGYGSKND